jgi:SAM-dependent methyltransferase
MIKQLIQSVLGYFGYAIYKISSPSERYGRVPIAKPLPIEPIWPLPRRPGGLSDEEIRTAFSKFEQSYYGFEFEGGLFFPIRHSLSFSSDYPEKHLQRFRHLMPHLIRSQNGTLQGKRVLDIACNSGFWSIQCALLGAEVVGFDARPEVIEQANLIKAIVGVNNVDFRVLDFWKMSPQSLGGQFDIVLFIGSLQVLPKPLQALELVKLMTQQMILLDTIVVNTTDSMVALRWGDEPIDIRQASSDGTVACPSKSSVELMLRHIGAAKWYEIPVTAAQMPRSYREFKRASWLITV